LISKVIASLGYEAQDMGHTTRIPEEPNIHHKEFDERYKKYREIREEIESDPKAPRGAIDLLAKGVTDFAIKSARALPGVSPFLEGADEKAAGETVAALFKYAIDRFGNKDEVFLLREPERVLTPHFLELLSKASENRRLVLMLDVFEVTSLALTPWLLALFKFEFGGLDTNVCFVISGRDPLEQHWTELAGVLCLLIIEPFTPEETRIYLNNQGITNDRIITQIHEDTGGLPVLVELLASTNPKADVPLPDVSADAVARFLQWVSLEEHRQVALIAAVPRQFNRDLLSIALNDDVSNLFAWLSTQSFVRKSLSRGWFYHEKVRELILRYLRNTTPQNLITTHLRLAEYFSNELTILNLKNKSAYESDSWRKLECERMYHLLCSNPEQSQVEVINSFLYSFRWKRDFAEEIAKVCFLCGRETGNQSVIDLANTLLEIYRAYDQDNFSECIKAVEVLRRRTDLTSEAVSDIYGIRGSMNFIAGDFAQAVQDLNKAFEIDETNTNLFSRLGVMYLLMGRPKEALEAITSHLISNEHDNVYIVLRGIASLFMGNSDDAIADFNKVRYYSETDNIAFIFRSLALILVGRYGEAIESLKHIDKSDDFLKVSTDFMCALSNILLGEDEEASHSISRITRFLDEKDDLIYGYLNEIGKRMINVRQRIIDGQLIAGLNGRGLIESLIIGFSHMNAGRYDEAALCLHKIVESIGQSFIESGRRFRMNASVDEVLTVFKVMVEPNTAKALRAFEQLISAIEKESPQVLRKVAPVMMMILGSSDQQGDYIQQVEQLLQMGLYTETISVADRILVVYGQDSHLINCRGEAYRRLGLIKEAIKDFSQAVTLGLHSTYVYSRRAGAYLADGNIEAAKADLQIVLETAPVSASICYNHSVALALSNKPLEAMEMLRKAISLDPTARIYATKDDLFNSMLLLPDFQALVTEYHLAEEKLEN
jgi:tetratricopeptide (TPR) repeat protein